ncbi:copper-translocating P-type ATPase, variant [Exophiala sideris]|uniref:Copper-translocating P-type ATPase, variant n=1 Tax=Exophiala sideris TaxID=1016849 RepID=A0A0D1YS12_9EURO|nr:copper-translocating P-type ATPase, variant [Exophiala sideris]
MESSRTSLAPCIACHPDGVTWEHRPDAGPCCDESCLETVARRQCTLECGAVETKSSSRDKITSPDEPESSVPSPQTRKRKQGACGTHSRSAREQFATTLKQVGCICKALITRNLEPCCKVGRPVQTWSTTAVARKTSSSSILNTTVNGSDCIKKGSCGGDTVESSSKRGERCGSKKTLGCSTVKKDDSYGVEEKGNSCSTKGHGAYSGASKADCGGAEQKRSRIGTNDDKCGDTEKKSSCYVATRDNCGASEDINCCGLKVPSAAKQNRSCCLVTEEDNHSGVTRDKCCGSEKIGCSTAKEDGCCGVETSKIVPSPPESCWTGADKGITGMKATNASCPGSGSSNQDGCSKDACCVGSGSGSGSGEEISFAKHDEKVTDHIDIEKGCLAVEHVVLDVQGLTCVGCETKLFRSLHDIPGVCNLRTSLVLSQAEFDLDEKAGPVAEVIKAVERNTGFACQRLNNEGQEVDVVVDDAKAFVERKYPDGVTQMIAADKRIVRIKYDAKIIGVRTLLEKSFNKPLTLADPRGSSELESGKRHVRHTAWITLLSSILTIPVLVLAWASLPPRPIVYGSASLVLATIVQVAIAGPFYPSALRALIFTHVIEMDLLIVLSTSTAYIFSVVSFAYQVAGRPLPTGEFFETSTLLVTLIMLGRWVGAFARQRAVESVSIRSLQAATAVLCDADGRGDREIDARLLQYGDLFKVTPDSRITTDGMIVSGMTEVDESMVTGESLPVEKHPGSAVIAGSLNGSGVLVVRLTHLPGNNTISTIAAMVDEAKFSKPKTQELVDIVASYFVPVILILTIVTFAIWVAIGISVRHQNSGRAVVNAIAYAISVLIVSCPCAIGLAVPMVVVIAGGVAAKHGVVFKSAMAIETARNVSHVVFDKTGTLTQGELSVAEAVYLSNKDDLVESITLGLTCDSKHPVSAAISTYLKEKGVDAAKIGDSKSVTGKGVEGTFDGANVRCGNTRWLSAETLPEVQDLLAKGLTVFGVAIHDQLIAVFGLSDCLRPDSHSVVTELQKRNIAISIVSGDDTGAVEAVAAKLGIPASHVRSRCTPSDKQVYLKNLMADEKKVVIFCGDGTNDAVALAQADIGVHMNSGSDVAQTAADVVLVRPYLGGILVLLDLSKAALHRIFFNFAWSFVYNLFAILLAAGAFVNARIPPQYAGLGEIVSVVPVILIALHLRWFKREY